MKSANTVMHLIAQLRFGAGRYVVDTAVQQAVGLKQRVLVCVSTDADEHWRTDPKLVSELAEYGVGVQVIGDFFHRRPELLRQSAARLRDICRDMNGPVIAHAHTAMAAAVGYWARVDGVVATCHGWGRGRPADVDLQDALAYQLCDSVVTYSSYWADRLRQDLSVSSPKVIPMGLNLDHFPPLLKRLDESSPMRMVTACELTARKGVDVLLNAMPAVWKEAPETELHVIGHGDAADDLRRQAAAIDPGLRRIVFYGTVANPYTYFGDFDLFVLPSRSDNLPVVLLEAMLAGLPIVSTDVGGIPELINAAGSGEIVPPESPTALAERINSAANAGRQALALVGNKGEQFVRDHMDVRETAAQLEPLYMEAIDRHHRRFVVNGTDALPRSMPRSA